MNYLDHRIYYQCSSHQILLNLHADCNPKNSMVRCLSNGGAAASAGMITSIYATRLGEIALTWSRTSMGLFLVTDLRLIPIPPNHKNDITDNFRLYLHPFYPWRRKGSKRRQFTTIGGRRRAVELSWDMSLATFTRDGGPGPAAGYFVSVSVDGAIAVIAGDNDNGVVNRIASELISRMERVRFGEMRGGLRYETRAWFEEKEIAIAIWVDVDEEEMVVEMDGEKVFGVGRLRWNFRGSEGMVMRSGVRVRVSWDLHDWLFWERVGRAGEAVFVFVFERCCGKGEEMNDSSSVCSSTTSEESGEEFSEEAELRIAGDGVFTLLVSGRKS